MGKSYAVIDSLRLLVQFKNHNMVTEEPLESMDWIVCRNVFIYFNRELQASVLEKFYKVLHSKGTLMLGRCESLLGLVGKRFEVADEKERIYQKKDD